MNKYQEALELLVKYAEAYFMINERDIDYRNIGLQEIKEAKEILYKHNLEHQPNALDKQFAESLEMLNKLGELK